MRNSLLFLALFASAVTATSQTASLWHAGPMTSSERGERFIVPERALYLQLDTTGMRSYLMQATRGSVLDLAGSSAIVELPLPDGEFLNFRFLETPLMHPDMGARYPYIRTYSGIAVDDPRISLKFDLTPSGFHAMVMGLPGGDVFIDPVAMGNSVQHQVYWKRDLRPSPGRSSMTCTYDEVNDLPHEMARTAQWIEQAGDARAGDCQFRTYRLALACTGDYANFFGATGSNKAPAIAAMATSLNRVNGIFERDAALTMVLVANNDQLVFTNPATDGYTNYDGGTMLDENQTKCDAVIGSSNYDIGHVFSTGGGGVAYLNSPCMGYKAGGVTGRSSPVGDPFDIDYVAHEMGHQYGGNHTQNNNCNRAGSAAVEVGSGITIMGYAGVCAPDVEPHSIAMFGGYSLQEIHANITTGNSSTCPQTVALINSPPTVSAGSDRTIPRNTPFVLSAVASDPDAGDLLTYSWEQMDSQSSTQPPSANSNRGPNFRPWLPVPEPQRWFPKLSTVASGTNPTPNWEVLANVARTYSFRVTVRDNAAGGGCNVQDNVTITVSGTTGPFLVTQPNTAVTWAGGSAQTVTWDPAGTSGSPVNCANVDILLSVDGGLTYPYTLATATPNDGSHSVTLPNTATTNARVMVRANGNVFYDMSDQDFTITAPEQVLVNAKVWLEGPFSGGQMNDDLRIAGLIPTSEPYTALGFTQVGNGGGESCAPSVLNATGANAIVDWVRLELRAAGSSSAIVATRQALLQRDGDIVDVDGTSPVAFVVPAGNYHVAVRHRNHLGCMTVNAISMGAVATTVDLAAPATATFGTDARKSLNGERLLWMGNAHVDNKLSYTGAQNDRDPIINRIGTDPTISMPGYYTEDCNMDGVVRYTGSLNDRDPILVNLGGSIPTTIRLEQLP
ncbi:MAG: hypothetical protein K8H89_14005 [Flavobacteriales bacterium]|jgi:hypothetical protein|nr:hypothetical protein [Flavobacteriales bacterium]MCB0756863.1 hypothetical protein [Flavobacteriales bacterium]